MPNILTNLISVQTAKYGDREVFRHKNSIDGEWIITSWLQFQKQVDAIACAMETLGLRPQENIAVFSSNRPEILISDYAAYANRAVPVSIYSTSSKGQVKYILNDSQSHILFVGNQEQYNIARSIINECKSVRLIVTYDDIVKENGDETTISFSQMIELGKNASEECHKEIARRQNEAKEDDIATILYTSGTTGEPKGAVLPHSCFNAVMEIHKERLTMLSDEDTSVCFLPLSHIFEKAWSSFCMFMGMRFAINYDTKNVQQTLKEFRPSCMCSVPRFWEKVYAGVNEVIAGATGVKKTLMQDAIKVGREHNVNYVCKGKTPPVWLHLKYKFYEKTIYSVLKKTLGLDRGAFFPTAGAAIPPAVQEFVLSVGINMVAGYGLTESLATVSCENNFDHEIGSVGKLMPHMQVKFGENDEILLKGPAITKGYYKKEAATKAAFTEDGWFRTGDAGYMKDDFLFLTERIKDLFKTSNGKYIAPQAIETKMVVDRYIDQISIIADERKFVAALIVPDYKLVEQFAAEKGIQYASMAELLKHEAVMSLFKERIDTLQQQFAHYEQIKKFTLLPEPFSMAKGELTNTLKIKRSVLNKNYAAEIEAMYAE